MSRSHLSPGLVLTFVCLPVFIGALDLTIISAVLPAVIADLKVPLQTGLGDAAWAVSGYLLAYAVSMTFMGRVSDVWGRRRVYLVCLAIFFIGSALVAASPGTPAQIASQLAQALGCPPHWIYDRIYNGPMQVAKHPQRKTFLFPDAPSPLVQLRHRKDGTLTPVA